MEAAGIIGICQTALRLVELDGESGTLLGEFLDLLLGTLNLIESYQTVDVSILLPLHPESRKSKLVNGC